MLLGWPVATVSNRHWTQDVMILLVLSHIPYLPEGMLPMCNPSDHNDGTFIPKWAMWFVVQLEEYLEGTGDRKLAEAARERVYGLLD